VKPSENNSEWLTRKRLVDPKLKAAGWRIVPFKPNTLLDSYEGCAIEEFETANGPTDYALCANGAILGIVEAKKLTLGPQSVLTQAERYSKGVTDSPFNYRGFRVPFLYSTNGEAIWHHDIRHELSRSHIITEFHTPEALIERLQRDLDTCCDTLLHTANDHPRLRPYQRDANIAIEKAIADRRQQMLVAMATGTGKTFTMVNEVYRPQPSVVVSVDLLTTGVDIPDLEGIVFLRPVKSRILFEQMLGRGTRKGEHFPDKSHFVVFDCFGGTLLEYFKKATEITAEPPEHEVRTITEIIEDIWNNRDRDYNIRRLVKRLQRIDKEMSAEARDMFAAFIPQGDMAKYASDLPRQLRTDFVEKMKLLREKTFQDLLVNYPRRQRTFLVATDTVDTVSSSWLVRGTDGKEYKPEDYLSVFARFIRENPAQVEAIRILLNRPRDWSTAALTELRQKLAIAPQRFTLENLRKAHEIHYHKALVDIISMVKHAANEQEPLYTAGDRVKLAMAKMTTGKPFTPEQIQWLDRIEAHLVENLTIEQEDFEAVPVFNLAGGWGRANRVFDGKLPQMIKQLNEAIAS
jgi:type I site-specific restriction endonuclease